MKSSSIYQDIKFQFLYFLVAYEIFNTKNIKLFVILFLFILLDIIFNVINSSRILYHINTAADIEPSSKVKKWKLNGFLISLMLIWIIFIGNVLFIRQDFWLILF